MPRPKIIQIHNGQKVVPTFSEGEYANRLSALRQAMSNLGLDAVVFTSIHNINYYSDFLYCAFGRPYALVVTHDAINSLSANIDGGQPWRRTVGGDNYVYTDWVKDNFYVGLQQLLPRESFKLGVEYDHISIERLGKLKVALPQARVSDIGVASMRLRMIKSAEEIEHIKLGARISDIGAAACTEAVGEGVAEFEVALHATQAMVRAIAESGSRFELMDTWTWYQSGINTDGAHNPVTSRRIEKGDILSLNCFSMIAGYYVAIERTQFYHHCNEASLRLWEANVEVHEAGQKLLTPGKKCSEVALELNEIYKKHNLLEYRTFGYGHSFGVLSHYYGREAGLELREDIETVIQPNMVISMEPMIMLPASMPGAGGYREHDILVITESGNENITGFPYGPKHNIIQ